MSEILFPTEELLASFATQGGAPAGGMVTGVVIGLAASLAAGAGAGSREVWPEASGAVAQANALRRRAAVLSTADISAYAHAREALAGERAESSTDRRDWALGRAVAAAADPPLALAGCAADLAQLAATIADRGAPEVRADAVVAAELAAAAAASAAHLVRVNLVVGGDERISGVAAAHAKAASEAATRAAASA